MCQSKLEQLKVPHNLLLCKMVRVKSCGLSYKVMSLCKNIPDYIIYWWVNLAMIFIIKEKGT
jgi:hypothetical protein